MNTKNARDIRLEFKKFTEKLQPEGLQFQYLWPHQKKYIKNLYLMLNHWRHIVEPSKMSKAGFAIVSVQQTGPVVACYFTSLSAFAPVDFQVKQGCFLTLNQSARPFEENSDWSSGVFNWCLASGPLLRENAERFRDQFHKACKHTNLLSIKFFSW